MYINAGLHFLVYFFDNVLTRSEFKTIPTRPLRSPKFRGRRSPHRQPSPLPLLHPQFLSSQRIVRATGYQIEGIAAADDGGEEARKIDEG